jgi:type IV secretory pathway VirB10-like protein
MDNDLSEYERLRLQNIKRNEEFLLQLGFSGSASKAREEKEDNLKKEAAKIKEEKRNERKRKERSEAPLTSTRKSPRLQQLAIGSNDESETEPETASFEEEASNFYDRMPLESNELDDFEFKIYVQLRKWRLLLSRELEIEPYKVFQNRTIAEFIRRKRNDSLWALPSTVDTVDLTDEKEEKSEKKETSDKRRGGRKKKENKEEKKEPQKEVGDSQAKELLQCWGIGPTKVKSKGFGIQLNDIFHSKDNDFQELLDKSRALSTVAVENSSYTIDHENSPLVVNDAVEE